MIIKNCKHCGKRIALDTELDEDLNFSMGWLSIDSGFYNIDCIDPNNGNMFQDHAPLDDPFMKAAQAAYEEVKANG